MLIKETQMSRQGSSPSLSVSGMRLVDCSEEPVVLQG
jgi:hypothetical protein